MNIFRDCIKDRDFAEDLCVPAHWVCDHGAGRFESCFGCILEGNLRRFNEAFYAANHEQGETRETGQAPGECERCGRESAEAFPLRIGEGKGQRIIQVCEGCYREFVESTEGKEGAK